MTREEISMKKAGKTNQKINVMFRSVRSLIPSRGIRHHDSVDSSKGGPQALNISARAAPRAPRNVMEFLESDSKRGKKQTRQCDCVGWEGRGGEGCDVFPPPPGPWSVVWDTSRPRKVVPPRPPVPLIGRGIPSPVFRIPLPGAHSRNSLLRPCLAVSRSVSCSASRFLGASSSSSSSSLP